MIDCHVELRCHGCDVDTIVDGRAWERSCVGTVTLTIIRFLHLMTNDSAIAMDAVIQSIVFTQLIINGQEVTLISEGGLNLCEIYEKQGR